jgi:tripartite-type tricarboxylate transporter receptor subunit TctC
MKRLSSVALAAVTAVAFIAHPLAARGETYPSRQTTIYVPYSPGGITDVLGRIIAHELTARLGKPFIVENKPGGGTVVAAMALTQAAADGYTLMMAPNGTLAINPTLRKSLPYQLKDIKPIALVGSLPFALVVNPSLPAKTVQDLVKLAKEKPGQLNYGSGGVGTNGAVFMELFESISDIKLVHVPFRGSAPQLTATMSDQVQVGFVDVNSASGLVKSGKLRALAVSSAKRFSGLPDVPTMQEAGVKGFDAVSWQMLVAPAATPKAVTDLLHSKVNAIIQSPDVKAKIVKLGVTPGGTQSLAELEKFVHSEAARWGSVIKKAGLAGKI